MAGTWYYDHWDGTTYICAVAAYDLDPPVNTLVYHPEVEPFLTYLMNLYDRLLSIRHNNIERSWPCRQKSLEKELADQFAALIAE